MSDNKGYFGNSFGHTESLWMQVKLPELPPLDADKEVDVCIVGAGIVGLTTAYTLLKEGKSVIVLDQGVTAGGQTARTTAHLTWALDDRYYDLKKIYGHDETRLALESHFAAIEKIEKIVKEENIDCDFERVDGFLFLAPKDSEEMLDKELNTIKKLGKEVFRVEKTVFDNSREALKFPNQGQFHILKYIKGLSDAIQRMGGLIYGNTHVKNLSDEPCFVETEEGKKVVAKAIVVATSTPINDRFYIHTKQAPYRTYVIAGTVPKDSFPKGLYWDTEDPYHYIRLQNHLTDASLVWVISGGEDHKTGQCDDIEKRYHELEQWTRSRIPQLGQIEYKWSGQVFEPVDSLGFIGKNPHDNNTYIATGDSGNGMTHGTIASMLIADLIAGKFNPWEKVYSPSRKTLKTVGIFLDESINVALQYADWFTPGETKTVEDLKAGEGAILREGAQKIAVFKDQDNQLYVNSAVCPHLGACVRWNPSEKCFDCPCHGSQFSGCGEVLNGPSIANLAKHKPK